jgi:ABC-2 type transport system ATP-binding protein
VAPGAVGDALERAGIATAGDRKVKGYSQGMRQRLGLATALLRRPALLLLDEPANGLDPAGIRDLRDVLRTLAHTGVTVFLSSHLLGEIEQVCDRVAVIDEGKLVSVGSVAGLGGAGEQIRVTVEPTETAAATAALSPWTVTSEAAGDLVVVGATGRAVNQSLVAAGIYASALEHERLSLEQRFLAITEGGERHATVPR